MPVQHRAVLLSLRLFQFVAQHHRLAAEHALDLLHRCLEQRPGVVAGHLHIGTRNTLALEHQLIHDLPLPYMAIVAIIVDARAPGSRHDPAWPCKQLKNSPAKARKTRQTLQ